MLQEANARKANISNRDPREATLVRTYRVLFRYILCP